MIKVLKGLEKFDKTSGLFAVALVALMPLERIPSFDLSFLGNVITLRLSAIVAIGLIIFSFPKIWENRKDLLNMPHIGLGLFIFFYILATGLAGDLERALFVLAFTCLVVGAAISLSFAVSQPLLDKIKTALYWTTVAVLIFGFYQYIGDVFGLSTAWTGLRADYTKAVFGFPRIQSTGLEPLYYANFLMIPLFIFGADFIKNNKPKPLLLLAIVTQLSLTVSRGAYAGALVGVLLLIIIAIRWKVKIQRIISLSAVIVGGIVLAYLLTGLEVVKPAKPQEKSERKTQAIVQQATNFDTQSDRDLNRELAWQAFSENPILGIGPGGIDKYLRANVEIYEGTDGKLIANNETLELLAEGGALSFLALAISLLWIVWSSIRSIWMRHNTSPQWPWMVGLLCYLFALAVQYQTFSTLYIMHVWVAIGILMGCIRIAESQNKPSSAPAKSKTKRNAKKA